MRWLWCVLLLAVPAGCATTPGRAPAPVSAPVRTPLLTSTPTIPGLPPSPPPGAPTPGGSPSGRAQGANAGPSYPGVYDASAAAAANYRLWLNYEMNSEADLGRGFESDSYPDGVFVCAQVALDTSIPAIEATLAGAKGWSGTGAAAIVKGALNALCPKYNQGYQTHFDRNVNSASAALAQALPWIGGAPGVYETGFFIKEACGYLQKVGTAQGLEAHLHTFRLGATNQNQAAAGFVQRVPDDQLLRRATHHAAFAGCLGDHRLLNGYWTQA